MYTAHGTRHARKNRSAVNKKKVHRNSRWSKFNNLPRLIIIHCTIMSMVMRSIERLHKRIMTAECKSHSEGKKESWRENRGNKIGTSIYSIFTDIYQFIYMCAQFFRVFYVLASFISNIPQTKPQIPEYRMQVGDMNKF